MRRWYSRHGAQRGRILAGATTALWIVWSVGYTQGATTALKLSASPDTTFTPVNVACCLQQLDT